MQDMLLSPNSRGMVAGLLTITSYGTATKAAAEPVPWRRSHGARIPDGPHEVMTDVIVAPKIAAGLAVAAVHLIAVQQNLNHEKP